MLKICLIFGKSNPHYAYKHYKHYASKQHKTSIQWTPGSQIYRSNQKIILQNDFGKKVKSKNT